MLGEADSIRSLNQKPPALSISIKAEMNFGKKGLWLEFEGKEWVQGVDEGEESRDISR